MTYTTRDCERCSGTTIRENGICSACAAIPYVAAEGLTGGRWVNDGTGVQVYLATVQTKAETPDIHSLIACLTCGARVDQSCRTKGGNPAASHKGRLAPRCCPCGAVAPRNAPHCATCAAASRRASWRAAQQRMRDKRKVAA